jgi:hypothetical protein
VTTVSVCEAGGWLDGASCTATEAEFGAGEASDWAPAAEPKVLEHISKKIRAACNMVMPDQREIVGNSATFTEKPYLLVGLVEQD